MNKKTIIWIVTGIMAIVLIVGVSVFVNKNTNEAEKETDDLRQEREDKAEDAKNFAKKNYGVEEDILSKEEISEAITKYNRDEDEELEDEEILEKLREEYGEYTARAYETGFMIDEGMSDEEKGIVMEELLGGSETIKKIVNPINGEFGNEKVEGEIKEIGDIYSFYSSDEVSYFGDTDGFYDIDGVKVGYPVVRYYSDPEEGNE